MKREAKTRIRAKADEVGGKARERVYVAAERRRVSKGVDFGMKHMHR